MESVALVEEEMSCLRMKREGNRRRCEFSEDPEIQQDVIY